MQFKLSTLPYARVIMWWWMCWVVSALLEWMVTTGVQSGSACRGLWCRERSGVKLKGVEQIWSYRQRETVRIHSDRDPCLSSFLLWVIYWRAFFVPTEVEEEGSKCLHSSNEMFSLVVFVLFTVDLLVHLALYERMKPPKA